MEHENVREHRWNRTMGLGETPGTGVNVDTSIYPLNKFNPSPVWNENIMNTYIEI